MKISVILASGSSARRKLLSAAGVAFSVQPADVDEPALRAAMVVEHEDDISPEQVAVELACEKAKAVSRLEPDSLVIGADQVLDFEGRVIEKSQDLAAARALLGELRGKQHALHSAFALARGGNVLFYQAETARLTMRTFSEAFLDDYLARAGEAILSCVGCYEIEGAGLQLFERIEGDYFTILGLPMMPLLADLRARGALHE
jgi:septum formation protein